MHSFISVTLLSTLALIGGAQSSAPAANTHAQSAESRSLATQQVTAMPVMSLAAKELARQLFQEFNAGQIAHFWSVSSPKMKEAMVSEDNFAQISSQIQNQLGKETKLMEEILVPYLGAPATVYTRLSEFGNAPMPIVTTITISDNGLVEGFYTRPLENPAETKFPTYQDKVKLRLPFAGAWFVYQGGRSTFENYHAAIAVQRFALDLLPLKNGLPFSGDGKTNDQYYCFGQPVLAPAAGTVAEAEGTVPDNEPGKPGQGPVIGNHLVLDHGNGEFSLLAHLKQGSLKVKKGDRVQQGQPLAECGNSGNSPVPHLHYQLQNSATLLTTEGLPAQFIDYVADGKPVASGEPVRGETIRNP